MISSEDATGTGFVIRPAVAADIDALVAIQLAGRDSYYRGVLPDDQLDDPAGHAELRGSYAVGIAAPDRTVICADGGDGPIGFAALGPPFEPVDDGDPATVGQLVGLYVLPGQWGAGIGASLHAESLRVWQEAGVTRARLEVWDANRRARDFYARHNWQPDGVDRPGPAGSPFIRLCRAVPTR